MKISERLNLRNRAPGANRPVLIVCLGDSVTHGCFELEEQCAGRPTPLCRPWQTVAMKLQRRLSGLYPFAAPTVLNAGVGGDNIEGMLNRLERDVLSFQPDLVILEAGLNDCCDGQLSPEAFGERVGVLMDRVLQSGAGMLLLTPNAMCSRVHENIAGMERWTEFVNRVVELQNGGVMSAYVEAERQAARRRGVPVADAYARWMQMERQGVDTTSLLANCINHPTEEMHDLFVEEILRAMQEE